MLLVAVLLVAAVIDFDTRLLPDALTLPLLWAGLIANMAGLFVDLQSAVIGAMAGYLSLWLVFWGYKLATGKDENHPDVAKFRDYFDYNEPISRVPSHRALAVFRGRAQEVLDVKLVQPEAPIHAR